MSNAQVSWDSGTSKLSASYVMDTRHLPLARAILGTSWRGSWNCCGNGDGSHEPISTVLKPTFCHMTPKCFEEDSNLLRLVSGARTMKESVSMRTVPRSTTSAESTSPVVSSTTWLPVISKAVPSSVSTPTTSGSFGFETICPKALWTHWESAEHTQCGKLCGALSLYHSKAKVAGPSHSPNFLALGSKQKRFFSASNLASLPLCDMMCTEPSSLMPTE
mmetsp:Transcript_24962/g.58164  ORF Transcript_24962/g.58164 Transcript_24962/m.58164 type:complete len:219 (+) Transcript_24962:463-1119(+)